MTMTSSKAPGDYEVGYGRPPKETRFKKGESGNPRGRPRTRGSVRINLDEILDKPVTVTQDGTTRTMSPKEVSLRKVLQKALTKHDLKSITYLLELFEARGAIEFPRTAFYGGVVIVPNTMPLAMGTTILKRAGPPPWSARQVQIGKAEYLEIRTDEQQEHDDAIAYPDLK